MDSFLPSKINNPAAKKLKVLVAPLHWGLGHATRCIPIIKQLINEGCTVIIAADGPQKAIIQEEFPDLSFVEAPGFGIKYGKNRALTIIHIFLYFPKILIGIKRENQWLRRFAAEEGLDLVISDNRWGLSAGGVFSVFMTHQLAIRTSLGAWADGLARWINYRYIRQFSVCWVPDVAEGALSLAGALSHPTAAPPVPVRYVGWLSRLTPAGEASVVEEKEMYDLLILLSGPEPQRTILEKMVIRQLGAGMGRMVLVRGLPGRGGAVEPDAGGRVRVAAVIVPEGVIEPERVIVPEGVIVPKGVEVYDYLAAGPLERVIARSRVVLARSGYSTVMDMVVMGKKVIYIPTPGQPEQAYLGEYLEGRGLGICRPQRGFILREALEGVERLKGTARMEGLEGVERLKGLEAAELVEIRRSVGGDALLGGEIRRVLGMVRHLSEARDLG